jgi:hypothetical protein
LNRGFQDGQRWIKLDFHDGHGNRCFVGAMRHIRAVHDLYGDATRYYLHKAMPHSDLLCCILIETQCRRKLSAKLQCSGKFRTKERRKRRLP